MTDITSNIIEKKKNNFAFELFDIVAFIIFVIGIMFFVRIFIFTPFSVVGLSMHPTFDDGDFIMVDKFSPKVGKLSRGDVLVFVPKGTKVPYIKRIIGLPGETVKIEKGEVKICDDKGDNCSKLEEKYLPEGRKTNARCGIKEFKVSSGYFVMGDNRGDSTDSRCCFGYGCYEGTTSEVQSKDILGKVLFRLFPNFQSDFSILDQKQNSDKNLPSS